MTSSKFLRFNAWLCWVLLCMGLLAQKALAANNEAAVVLFSHGPVTVTTSAVSHDLKKGDTVLAGSTITTGDKGRVQLRFNDGGLVSLMPNTQFAVETYQEPSAAAEGELGMNLIKGGLRALSGQIGKRNPDSYQLKTKVATLGIRGTQFTVSMDADGMRVHVGAGQIILINELGELLVSAGQNAQVLPNQAPAPSALAPNVGSAPAQSGENSDTVPAPSAGPGVDGATPDTQLAQGLPITLQQTGNTDFAEKVAGTSPPVDPHPINPNPVNPNPEPKFVAAYYKMTDSNKTPEASVAQTLSNINLAMKFVDSSFGLTGDSLGSFELDTQNGGLQHLTEDLLWGWLGTDADNPTTLFVLGNNIALPASGILSYRYDPQLSNHASEVFRASGQGLELELNKFNLDLHLGTNKADVDMELIGATGQSGYLAFTDSGDFSWQAGSSSFSFDFHKDSSDNQCSDCRLEVAGVVTGANSANAGLIYKLGSNGFNYSGTVLLDSYQNIQYSPSNAAYLWIPEASTSTPTPQTHSVNDFTEFTEALFTASQGQEFVLSGTTYSQLEVVGADQYYHGDTLFWSAPLGSYQDNSDPNNLIFAATQTFVMLGAPTLLPATGTLSYSLSTHANAASSVFNQLESYDDYLLEKFDLTVHLSSNSFDVNMQLNNSFEPLSFQQSGLNGELTNDGRFAFTGMQNDQDCNSCTLHAAGIITGTTQQEAGVVYYLQQGARGYAGAAALEQTSYVSN